MCSAVHGHFVQLIFNQTFFVSIFAKADFAAQIHTAAYKPVTLSSKAKLCVKSKD